MWRNLQESNPELVSPCFSPEFTQAVAAVRPDVEVAVVQGMNNEIRAFFPFQRHHRTRAIPVGGIVSDYQGIICRPDFECDPRDLLEKCGLVAWDFDRLIASQEFFLPYHKLCEPSALIDLSRGYAAYVQERRAAGSRQISQCQNSIRRLEREAGPLRFIAHSPDRKLLSQVLAWKSEQYLRTGWRDLFAPGWGRDLVERIHAIQSEKFAGMFSALYAGEHLIAGHLGMRSSSVWHYWFPAYDRRFSRFSPGLILLLHMAEHGPSIGIRALDLGTGMSLYKERLMSASVSVAEGSVERPSWLWLRREAKRAVKSLVGRVQRIQ